MGVNLFKLQQNLLSASTTEATKINGELIMLKEELSRLETTSGCVLL
jgi:hypothetical protein